MKKLILFAAAAMVATGAWASGRLSYTINDAWRFTKGSPFEAFKPAFDDSSWDVVSIPHTWNAADADDPTPGYYRGPAWYRRTVTIDKALEGRRAVLYFEGADQQAEVWVNGEFIGKHTGGYTRFSFDVTDALRFGEGNLVAVMLTNAYDPHIPPLSADFTFFGGIYRDVSLLFTAPVHVATDYYASSGVFATTPEVTRSKAVARVRTLVSNDSKTAAAVTVRQVVCDASGKEVATASQNVSLAPAERKDVVQEGITIANPRLWDTDDPYLYALHTYVYDAQGNLLDEVYNPLGFRTFSFDPDKGFTLNGRRLKLRGTNRHQDYLGLGNALRDEMHVRDVRLLKDMGGNFLRISHYPQDPVINRMCDRLGIVTSVEIPVVNAVTPGPEFLGNCTEMLREMIWQNFNHPSVMIWAYMNEPLLRNPYKGDAERCPPYFKAMNRVASTLDSLARALDPTRYTMIAFHNDEPAYRESGLTAIPMIQGWNLYQGWYEPDLNDFNKKLDFLHGKYPDQALIVTEYGADNDPRLHSFAPERFDMTQEYALEYHRHYYRQMTARDFVAGYNAWNINDFYSESRASVNPHVNNKGLTSLDREHKDSYLFYQAVLKTDPVLWIGNREWKTRGGAVNAPGGKCVQQVPVFSNLGRVELIVNGSSAGSKDIKEGVAFFDVPFVEGMNRIEAVARTGGRTLRDVVTVDFHATPDQLGAGRFTELNVMLGSARYFEDRAAQLVWIPEQPYRKGGWGYVGGEAFRRGTGNGSLPGSDADIYGTDQNALFQTQRRGIGQFRADVPDGRYSVYCYWAELDSDKKTEALVYNLGADAVGGKSEKRVFDLAINGLTVLTNFDLAARYGCCQAVIKKFEVTVRGGEGLVMEFTPRSGQAILNAVRIVRDY